MPLSLRGQRTGVRPSIKQYVQRLTQLLYYTSFGLVLVKQIACEASRERGTVRFYSSADSAWGFVHSIGWSHWKPLWYAYTMRMTYRFVVCAQKNKRIASESGNHLSGMLSHVIHHDHSKVLKSVGIDGETGRAFSILCCRNNKEKTPFIGVLLPVFGPKTLLFGCSVENVHLSLNQINDSTSTMGS